jgi:hypothetical protein
LVQQIDSLDKELNDLSSAMMAEVQKPDASALTVYNINLQLMNKVRIIIDENKFNTLKIG